MYDLSVLRLVCGDPARPREEEVRARIEPFAALVRPEEPLEVPPEGGWMQGWRTPEGDAHLLQLEPNETRSGAMHLLLAPLTGREKRRIRAGRWRLVLTTRLDRADPLAAFGRQLRFATLACPDVVGLHDLCSTSVLTGDHVRTVASWATPPPATALYQIHGVHPPDPRRGWWLHTHGLERTGLPDVDMMRIPALYADAAAELIHAFVRAHLGRDLPLTGETDPSFDRRGLAWMPVEEAAADLGTSEIGRIADRLGDDHGGRRIALVESGGSGSWRPPLALLRDFRANRGIVRYPAEESERAASLARERWSVFARLHTEHSRDSGWHFDVCSWIRTGPRGREYLWWEVLRIESDRVLGRCLTSSTHDRRWPAGAESWRELASIADWTVTTPTRTVRPDTVRIPA